MLNLHDANNKNISFGRRRYQGLNEQKSLRLDVLAGEAGCIKVAAGALLSITNVDGGRTAWMTTARGDTREFTCDPFKTAEMKTTSLDYSLFDDRQMRAIAEAKGGALENSDAVSIFDENSKPGDVFLLKFSSPALFFLIAPIARDYIETGGGARYHVEIKETGRVSEDFYMPTPLGKVVDEWRVGAGTAKAYEIKKGQFLQIIDVEGQQCSDFMAMRSSALDKGIERYIDSTVTRTCARGAYPAPGLHNKFYDQDITPLLAVRRDTVGRHDTFGLACNAYSYEERGFPGHINCSDNISHAYAPFGIKPRKGWPAINFFWNSNIDPTSNVYSGDEPWSRPGDYVVLEALTDLVGVSTACPDDIDPTNGWNPTDIHVRVYEEDSSITHSVAWRAQPDDAEQLTKHSAFHPRTSQLTKSFYAARDLWMPTHYDATGAIEEYWACRKNATLQDMSGLFKYDIVGPDALELLQHCLTRNIAKLSVHRGLYALICDERGSVLDDGTLFCIEPNVYRWFSGSNNSALHLREQAELLGLEVKVLSIGHKMANLALQGPKSRDILKELVFTHPYRPDVESLKWFGFTIARIHDRDGPVFMLCRSGFTGELGYEIFCDEKDAVEIWDAVMKAGEPHGLTPMGGHALDMLRIEAGLMISGAEFGGDVDAIESGLGFAVDFKKTDFIGKAALERNQSAIRRELVGLKFNSNEAPHHGDPVFLGREEVGVVTSACTSPELGYAIAMARIAVENSEFGTELEVGKLDGHMKRLPCITTGIPFIDPKREKARA